MVSTPPIIKNEQKLFDAFIQSLQGIESFCFDFNALKSVNKEDLYLPSTKLLELQPDQLKKFFEKNYYLKELYVCLSSEHTEKTFKEALNHLTCLETVHYKNENKNYIDFLDHPNMYKIKDLTYSISSLAKLESLKNYKNLTKLTINLKKYFSELASVVDQIVENLNQTNLQELSISAVNNNLCTNIIKFPTYLKKFCATNLRVDLNLFFESITESTELCEVYLNGCVFPYEDTTDKKIDLLRFNQYQNLKILQFVNCSFEGEYQQLKSFSEVLLLTTGVRALPDEEDFMDEAMLSIPFLELKKEKL